MKLCISESVFPVEMSYDGMFSQAAQTGFEALELVAAPGGRLALDTPKDDCRRLATLASENGLEISALVVDAAPDRHFAASSEEGRLAYRDQVIAALDRAFWMGARAVLIEPALVARPHESRPLATYEDAYSHALHALTELRFEAEQRAVCVGFACCENRFLLSPTETRDFTDLINSPWVGSYLDVAHSAGFGFPQDWIRTLGRRIVRITLSDFDVESDPIDWPAVRRSIEEVRYDGPVICRMRGDLPDIKSKLRQVLG